MSANTVFFKQNRTTVTQRGPSPAIWADCPVLDIIENPGKGIYFFDDFLNFSQHVSDQDTQQYSSYIDTGVTITSLPVIGGVIEVAGNDADNDEGSITTGGNTGTMVVIDTTAGNNFKLWFECRIKKASVADNALGFFVGLAEEGQAVADVLVNDTAVLKTTIDGIGFRVKQDNGEEIDFTWQKASQTNQELANISTMVADTYVKLGFVFDPSALSTQKIKVFVDNVEYSTKLTSTDLAAATFPLGEELALLMATKVGTAAESKFEMDWWRLAQVYF